jgi:excisionase family DNA binding protein
VLTLLTSADAEQQTEAAGQEIPLTPLTSPADLAEERSQGVVAMAHNQLSATFHESAESEPRQAGFDPTLLALTVEEAARRLSIGRTTMYALIRDGAVKTVPIGRCRRVPVQSLSDYLTRHMQARPENVAA